MDARDVTPHLCSASPMAEPAVKRPSEVLYKGSCQKSVYPEAADQNGHRLNAMRSKTHKSISQEPCLLRD